MIQLINYMNLYEYTSLILVPFVVIHFSMDFLSDSQVSKDETKIGVLQFLHSIICSIFLNGMLVLPFIKGNIGILSITILVSIATQIGYLINNDFCWLTTLVNTIINPDNPKRKWVGGDISSLIKKYIRGDDWACSDIKYIENTKIVILTNTILIVKLLQLT